MVGFFRPSHSLPLGVVASVVIALVLLMAQRSPTAQAAPRQVTSGSLAWGIKASFRSYITGPIAHGAIAAGGGASQSGDSFIFPVASGSYDSTGVTNVTFNGSVHFTGHDGQLDMTVSNLRVQMSGSSKMIIADIVSKAMNTSATQSYPNTQFATLTGGNAVEGATTATWTALPASLTAMGVTPFAGFYTAGTPLDPATISLNLAGAGVPTNPLIPTATFIPGVYGASPTPYVYVYGSGATTTTPYYDSTPTPIPGTVATSNPVAGGTGFGTTTTTTTTTNSSGTTTTTTTTTGGGGGGGAVAPPIAPVAAYAPAAYGTLRPPSTGDGGLAAMEVAP